jgi:folate-binding protein YgfZ
MTMSDATTKTVIETPLLGVHKSAGAAIGTWFGCALPDHFSGAADRGDIGEWLEEYRAVRETVALLDKNYRAYLRFTGPDRGRYLNAILTNNVKDLAPGNGVVSLFLNPQGRIQAEIETYATSDSLFCVTHAMIRETLVPALDKFIIMDDVTLTDETEKYGTLALEGPRAANVTRSIASLDLAELQDLEFREVLVRGISCRMTKRSPAGVPGAEFLVPRENLSRLWETLEEAVASTGGRPMGYQALSALRLEQGVPWFGYDFGDRQIPHEAGLENSHISYTKGCYTGQEIVERVRSRGHVNRVRVLLKFESSEPPVAVASLLADGKEIGYITRSAFSPILQAPIGMGYVRRESSAVGSEVRCGEGKAVVIVPPLKPQS